DVGGGEVAGGGGAPSDGRGVGDAAAPGRFLELPGGEGDGDGGLVLAVVHEAVVDAHAVGEPAGPDAGLGVLGEFQQFARGGLGGHEGLRALGLGVGLGGHVEGGAAEGDEL